MGFERDEQNTPFDLVRRNGSERGDCGLKPKPQEPRYVALHGRSEIQYVARTSEQQTREGLDRFP